MASGSQTEFNERFEASWEEIDSTGARFVHESEVKNALDLAGYKLPNHRVREILTSLKAANKIRHDGMVSKEIFKQICREQKSQENTKDWITRTLKDDETITHKSDHGDSYHMILKEEQRSFSNWINENLLHQNDLGHLLPLAPDGLDIYEKITDGILLCKLINFAVPDTIDNRVINKGPKLSLFKKHENLTLAITSARSIGCTVINMDSHMLSKGTQHLVLGIIWQIIARYLFNGITLQNVPGLIDLLRQHEDPAELLKMSPEQILLRWVNYQLGKAGCERQITNFSKDIRDSVAYSYLVHQVAPKGFGVSTSPLMEGNLNQRAEAVLVEAGKIGCRSFVTSADVVNGVDKLNLAFVANLFNNYPCLEDPQTEEDLNKFQETREEKMYRNWMNSLGVDPYINYLYTDLYDGLIMFQIYEIIQPGIVNWKRVVTKAKYSKMLAKKKAEILQNSAYAVELGRKLNFILVGIDGNDIMTGNKVLTLGLVWQMMRKYTLSLLAKLSPDGTPIVETEILAWANNRLEGKSCSVKHFQDKVNRTALPVIHLIDSMRSGVIDYSMVKTGKDLNDQECMSNAKYAVTMARKIGAPVYALPEDLVEVKHKMVMTVYASLMLVDMK